MQGNGIIGRLLAILFILRLPAWAGEPLVVGADVNYTLAMEKDSRSWSIDGKPRDLFALLRDSGFTSIRLRIWTGEESLNDACTLGRRAQAQGLALLPVLFLSENWADYVKQPLPAVWKDLPFDERVKAVRSYATHVAQRLKAEGLRAETYAIGNETDFGLCGEFEEEWGKRLNPAYMQATIWPRMARLVRAAEEGVREVQPDAKFLLHLTQWWNPDFGVAFFRAMKEGGATIDYAGLSFYPTSGLSKENSFAAFRESTSRLHTATGLPIIICESGYPSAPQFPGQFSTWNHPVEGFSLDEDGQARWLTAFLQTARDTGYICGVYYWSPEWYTSDMWSAFALFDAHGSARKALLQSVKLPAQ